MAYVYRHIRLDLNKPFYIGIGSDSDGKYKRAFSKYSRNLIWNGIVSKSKYEVEILFDDLSWEEACQKEKEFISLYGRIDLKNGILSNLTDGGDGSIGVKVSLETRLKQSEKSKGRKAWNKGISPSNETKEKIRQKLLGENNFFYGKKHTEESKKKMSESIKENFTDERRNKISKMMTGNKYCLGSTLSEETKSKIGIANKGNKHCLGRVLSEETKNKISSSNTGIKKNTRENHPKARLIINFETGIFYGCIKDAFEVQKSISSINTFTAMLRGICKNKTSFQYSENF